jgi:hypothetical protein
MRKLFYPATFLTLAWLGFAPAAAAQNDFEWTGQLAPGQRIEIQDVNGSIHASAARDGNIVVTAVKKAGRRGNPGDIRIETYAHAGGVTVCVLYPGSSDCRSGGSRNSNNDRNDTSVEFTVLVPAGVGISAHTVNGSVDANGLQSNTEAGTVNGSVTVATSGTAQASTVNGDIKAAMGAAPNGGKFSTVNGGITLQLPASTNANVRVSTVSGDIRSDFPLQMSPDPGPKNANGVIGAGGQELRISTVNGEVTLVRR